MRVGNFVGPPIVLAAMLAASCYGQANVALTTGVDPHQLQIGSPVQFFVELTGLPLGAELDSLFATVEYDVGKLGLAVVSPGGILPNPLHDPLDFVSNVAPGLVDGAFTTIGLQGAQHISQVGVFYSFALTPIAAGSGSISLSFADASRFNTSEPDRPILIGATTGAALQFTVLSNLPGDYSGDGQVDAADYTVWRDRLGTMGTPGIPGDGSGPNGQPDGVVDQFDYVLWKSRFGTMGGGSLGLTSVHTVPEPGMFSSLIWILLGGFSVRNMRCLFQMFNQHKNSKLGTAP